MSVVTMQTQGFAELESALRELGRAVTQKASLRRAMRKAAQPLAALAQAKAPRGETQTLAPSIGVGTRLSKRQAKLHRRMFRDDRAAVEMFVGAGPFAAAWNQEFGNINHRAQPYLRPAWDQDKHALLDRLGTEIRADIDRTLARARRRAARAAARA